jgi:hypothetical protein
MGTRGEQHTYVNKTADGRVRTIAMAWLDRERRYLLRRPSQQRKEAHTLDVGGDSWRPARRGWKLLSHRPVVTELYYSCCAKIDQHNIFRLPDMEKEKVFQVRELSFRVNSSLLAIIIVDSWMVYRGAVGDGHGFSQIELYIQLASELIENCRSSLRERKSQREEVTADTERPRSGISALVTPTKRKRKNKQGETLPYIFFGNCCE